MHADASRGCKFNDIKSGLSIPYECGLRNVWVLFLNSLYLPQLNFAEGIKRVGRVKHSLSTSYDSFRRLNNFH